MWFQSLMGFQEESPEQVRANIWLDGPAMVSRVNGRAMVWGRWEMPTLGALRERVGQGVPVSHEAQPVASGGVSVSELVANVQQLHESPEYAGAMFQVASQFNMLEMTSPRVTPEQGIDIYEWDHTQGPACAIAAGAGTVYRNYFVDVERDGRLGQSSDRQLDGAAELGHALGNHAGELWQMQNGYLLPSDEGIRQIQSHLLGLDESQRDALRARLRIGLQWNTQVTLGNACHCVSQAYCSATPVSYSSIDDVLWEPLARLVLEAAYEATVWAAMLPERLGPNNQLLLTLLGGGAFGNWEEWIIDAIDRALTLANRLAKREGRTLDAVIVSYGASRPEVEQLVRRWNDGDR